MVRPREKAVAVCNVQSGIDEIGRCRIDQVPCFVEGRSVSLSRSGVSPAGLYCRIIMVAESVRHPSVMCHFLADRMCGLNPPTAAQPAELRGSTNTGIAIEFGGARRRRFTRYRCRTGGPRRRVPPMDNSTKFLF